LPHDDELALLNFTFAVNFEVCHVRTCYILNNESPPFFRVPDAEMFVLNVRVFAKLYFVGTVLK
jgi:hypothetical protein